LFEAMVVELAKGRPVAGMAGRVGDHDTGLWRFIGHYADQARLYEDHAGVGAIGIDGTSREGHRCITVLADPAGRDVIRVVPGRDANAVERFALDVMGHNGDPDRVAPVTCDMGPGFAKGIRERPPDAARVIDRFHVVRHANGAVDEVRRTQAGRNPLLGRTTYPWPRNEEGLTGLRLETQA
jgi:transposase